MRTFVVAVKKNTRRTTISNSLEDICRFCKGEKRKEKKKEKPRVFGNYTFRLASYETKMMK
jgi:hypothetical protein